MDKQQIIDYVMNNPANTNPNVLGTMLDGVDGGAISAKNPVKATLLFDEDVVSTDSYIHIEHEDFLIAALLPSFDENRSYNKEVFITFITDKYNNCTRHVCILTNEISSSAGGDEVSFITDTGIPYNKPIIYIWRNNDNKYEVRTMEFSPYMMTVGDTIHVTIYQLF